MSVLETSKLEPIVEKETDLLRERAEILARAMTREEKSQRNIYEIYDWEAEATRRIGPVATFMIEACDFIDSLDHRTTDEVGGTDVIQNFAMEVRQATRKIFTEASSEIV